MKTSSHSRSHQQPNRMLTIASGQSVDESGIDRKLKCGAPNSCFKVMGFDAVTLLA